MNTFINLTQIRHRFEPQPKLTAMELFWTNERRERRKDWIRAIGHALLILLTVIATAWLVSL